MSDPVGDLRAILAEAAERRRQDEGNRPRRHSDGADGELVPASGWLEDGDFVTDHRDPVETREDQDRRRRTYSRQVCVRLSPGQWSELEHAADLYGVPPSTMSRILIRRGARAVLEHHRRYDLEQGGLD